MTDRKARAFVLGANLVPHLYEIWGIRRIVVMLAAMVPILS